MTYEEAKSRRNFAKPTSFLLGEVFIIRVVPGKEQDYESYMSHLRSHMDEVQDADAIPFSSDGTFTLRAFIKEDGRIISSECAIIDY